MATQVNAKARDFHFTLDMDQSCNCCRKKKSPSPDLHVYIHKDGSVERFSFKKADDVGVALCKSIGNLKQVLEGLAELEGKDKERLIHEIRSLTDLELDETKPQEIRLREIAQINAVLKDLLRRSLPE